jgi:CelD/BcsL family acetyltransferase involved in cellulose biosynthesis
MITVQTLTDPDELAAMAREWDALVRLGPPDEIFCTHAVAMAAQERQRADPRNTLHVLVLRENGRLVGLAPMIRRRLPLGFFALRWLYSGTPLYTGLPCRPGREEVVFDAIAAELRRLPRAQRLGVDHVPHGSRLWRLLEGLGARERPGPPIFGLPLETPDAGWQALSPSRRKAMRRQQRVLARLGDLQLRRVDDPEELAELTRWIIARKRDWLMHRHVPGDPHRPATGWISLPATERFFVAIARELARSGQAYGVALMLDGRRVTGDLLFRHGATALWSKTAYEPDFRHYSPGWLGFLATAHVAQETGARHLDLMTAESDLKLRCAVPTGRTAAFRLDLGGFARLRALWPRRRP